MKKLLITGSTFPRWKDDTEPRFILDYAKAMTKYYEVHVLVPMAPGANRDEIMEGVHVHRFHYFPIHKYETLCYPGAIVPRIKEKRIRALLVPFLFLAMFFFMFKEKNKYDYIHSNWVIPQGIVQAQFNKKYILSGLGGDVSSINKGIMKKVKKKALDKAEHITVVSNDLKNILIKEYDIDEKKIAVIPMGCDTVAISPNNRVENLWNQGDKKTVLFVGRLVEKKGLKYLIKAMKGIDAKLIVVGNGPEYEKMKTLINEEGIDAEMVGAKNKEELKIMYASCDVYCIPSVVAKDGDKDGTPVSLIEAMASGAPIVGTRLGGIEEVVKNEENGLLIEPEDVGALHDALYELIKNDKKRKEYAVKSQELAQKYDFAVLAGKYRKILEGDR